MSKLQDSKAYALLKKYGIPIAPFVLVKNVRQAQAAAAKLGYPIVLKIDAEIIHKAKAGCVKIVNKPEELARAYDEVIKNAKKQTKKIAGIIIQPLIRGSELIVGGKRDPSFGTIIMFGSGGVLADVLKDVAFRVLPIDRFEAEMMIQETKAPAAIPAVETQSRKVADVILKVAHLLEANPKITELDINPLFLTAKGPVAADVRIIEA
ncbi:MAG: acetate--CoA ligase family protein [Candidatus Aenigmatarchaeota archaeon]